MWIITIININNIYLYIYIYSQWDPVIKVYRWQWNLPIELQRECHDADLLECNSQSIRESSWRLIHVSITTPVITIIIIIICCINIMRHSWMIEIPLIDWLMDGWMDGLFDIDWWILSSTFHLRLYIIYIYHHHHICLSILNNKYRASVGDFSWRREWIWLWWECSLHDCSRWIAM